jgi:hypothetical protein
MPPCRGFAAYRADAAGATSYGSATFLMVMLVPGVMTCAASPAHRFVGDVDDGAGA